jgi:hypothetical protein
MIASVLVIALLPAASPSPAARVRARSHAVVGEVAAAPTASRLDVRTKTAETVTFELPAAPRIVAGGRVARVADLTPGTRVVVTCAESEPGKHRATLVRVVRPK